MTTRAQGTSTEVIIGPVLNVSGSVMVGLDIANTAIALVKYASVSAARAATTSAVSVGPGMYRVVLNGTDTDTMGEMAVWVSGSAALPFVKYVDIWQAPTWNLFYGSADQVLGSAAASAIVSVGGNTVLVNYDVASSADVSAIVSAVISGVLNSYNVASAGEVASAGINSAGISAIVQGALVAYDVPTSADVSAIGVGVLTGYDVPTSADVSAIVEAVGMTSGSVSALIQQALVNYDVATSADVSAIVSAVVSTVLANYDVPTSADISAIVTAVAQNVLTSYDVPTSADISAIGVGVLTGYDVPTSADISAIVGPAVWGVSASEPVSAATWTSMRRGTGFDWMVARSLNRHAQTGTEIEIFTSAGTVIASASVSNNSASAVREQFID